MPAMIKVENVGKRYRIGQPQAAYSTLRESLVAAVRSPFKTLTRNNEPAEFVWAIEDVSFEVKPGEVVGLIGRNGAGKSTLLKMLSRITEPTKGRILLGGRVGSLLEVGTGFHAELTGRENIYLNGAILGMARTEIVRKFDEIVSFAEVEKFIDTPVKHYSSGMYLRLAFAVAAHLEPEILLVDEVLAVGDARFQRKCLDKMQDVGNQGHTILFVSHNMAAITRLCPRTILLDHGHVLSDGPSHQVASEYLSGGLGTTAAREWPDVSKAPGDEIVRLLAVRVRAENGEVHDVMDIREPVAIEMEFVVLQGGHKLTPNYHFFNEHGVYLFVAGDNDPAWFDRPRPSGRFVSTAWIPGNLLAEGTIIVGAAVTTRDPEKIHFFEREAVAFQVIDSMDGDSVRGGYSGHIPGVVRPMLKWDTRYTSEQCETMVDVASR
jgi:lipopolysaccharide transport system ATP-binding protein